MYFRGSLLKAPGLIAEQALFCPVFFILEILSGII
jgi:hypothetical protein